MSRISETVSGWRLPNYVALTTTLVALILFFLPAPEGAPDGVMRTAGLIVFTVGLWATAVMPEYHTSILFFVLAALLGVAPRDVIFSGFHSTAIWVIFGGLVIGVAVQTTGLGARMAHAMVGWIRGSYLALLAGLVVLGCVMALLIPSATGRMVILVPIALALAERLGFEEGSNGRAGLAMAAAAGTLYPAFGILPAAVPNLTLLGAAQSLHGIDITYGEYLRAQFPVIAPVSVLVLPFILRFLFPDHPRQRAVEQSATPFSRDERVLLTVMILALALWMTDFIHGVSPAWIAMAAALLCLTPRLGMLPPSTVVEKVNFGPWFFVAGVIGMSAVVTASGLGTLIGKELFSVVEFTRGADFQNFTLVSAIGMAVGFAIGMPGQPAIMSALAPAIADGTGWPLLTVLMAQAPSWPMALFPYELPPIVVAMYLGRVRVAKVTALMGIMAVLTWVVIMPLQFLWLDWLGFFG